MKAHPEAPLKIAVLTEEASQTAIPMRREASTESLRQAINDALSEAAANGDLTRLSEKYFGTDISVE